MGYTIGKCFGDFLSSRVSLKKGQEFYLTYTSRDHEIPLKPDGGVNYAAPYLDLISTTRRVAKVVPYKDDSWDIMKAFIQMSHECTNTYHEVPTIIPRFPNHNRKKLHALQRFLKPINCCPSMHTAYATFEYIVGMNYLEKEKELRQHLENLVTTVIGTKLHAMIDVAFGMYISKKTIEEKLDLAGDCLEDFLTQKRQIDDKVPWEEISGIYYDVQALAESSKRTIRSLADLVLLYFQETGLPRITLDQSNHCFDLENKELVPIHEATIGKGMF